MEFSQNQVTIAGNVTTEITIKNTNDNKKYCYVRVAVSREYGGMDFVSVKFWGADAELCFVQLKKGDAVIATGQITVESYEVNGKQVYITYVKGQTIGKILKPQVEQ